MYLQTVSQERPDFGQYSLSEYTKVTSAVSLLVFTQIL